MTILQIDWPRVAVITQTFLTPVIGVATIVLGIATFKIQQRQTETQRQQAETNALQLRLALFERRMKVFDSTVDLLAAIVREANVELNQLFDLQRKTREEEFLFGSEITEYINEVFQRGVELNTRRRRAEAVGNENERDFNRETELLMWFVGQVGEARKLFLPYIDFKKP